MMKLEKSTPWPPHNAEIQAALQRGEAFLSEKINEAYAKGGPLTVRNSAGEVVMIITPGRVEERG